MNFSGGGPPDRPPFLWKLRMTVQINQKKPDYIYYSFYIEVQISGKILQHPPPQIRMLRYVPACVRGFRYKYYRTLDGR